MKLEIGCGTNPLPGYVHLDVRPLPHVEFVCDFSKEKLPFLDNELDEVMMCHSIEHVSFRCLPHLGSELKRCLKPGGKLYIRTPDLFFICQSYLANRMTPEFPPDEEYLKKHFGEITIGWWANLKLYAGQEYPSNFHMHCFDFEMINNWLLALGFKVERNTMGKDYSPGELQIEATKK